MKREQADLLHKCGIQLLSRASEELKVKDIISLSMLAMKMFEESRNIGAVDSVWGFVQQLVEGLTEPTAKIEILYSKYGSYCKVNSLELEDLSEFRFKLAQVFAVSGSDVKFLPEKLN